MSKGYLTNFLHMVLWGGGLWKKAGLEGKRVCITCKLGSNHKLEGISFSLRVWEEVTGMIVLVFSCNRGESPWCMCFPHSCEETKLQWILGCSCPLPRPVTRYWAHLMPLSHVWWCLLLSIVQVTQISPLSHSSGRLIYWDGTRRC